MPELRLEKSIVDERYAIDRCLGRGSYAEIFLAVDRRQGNHLVIIKALNTTLQGTVDLDLERTLVENFQNEALALDKVRHPGIIRRLGHGTAADLDGVPFHYLVLEYMPGGDMAALCRRRALTLDEARFYFKQVAEALAFAHSRQVIHRDIKPNNLLLSADHRVVKIADFGVAKMTLDEADEITRVGTNVYAPPEHHPDEEGDGAGERLTPSADVYSLAKTIYTAMTRVAPRRFARQPITSLPAEIADKPWGGRLLAVLRKATASRVADRYQSVEEFWEAFATLDEAPGEDPEATVVRSRLKVASDTGRSAARPDFQPLAVSGELLHPQKARIVVELPGRERRATAPAAALQDSTGGAAEPEGRVEAAEAARGERPAVEAGPRLEPLRAGPANAAVQTAGDRTRKLGSPAAPGAARRFLRRAMRADWLSRAFIVLLIAAIIGLAKATYDHFASQRRRLPDIINIFQGDEAVIGNAANVNLRSEPGGSVLAPMPQGTRVRVLETRGGWVRVRVLEWAGGAPAGAPGDGWVDGRYVRKD